jgi:hypothetical protein
LRLLLRVCARLEHFWNSAPRACPVGGNNEAGKTGFCDDDGKMGSRRWSTCVQLSQATVPHSPPPKRSAASLTQHQVCCTDPTARFRANNGLGSLKAGAFGVNSYKTLGAIHREMALCS